MLLELELDSTSLALDRADRERESIPGIPG